MLERQKARNRPHGAAEIEEDIRKFWTTHRCDSDFTRHLRNTYWRCQKTTGYLQDMLVHCQHCPACQPHLKGLEKFLR